MNIIDRLFDINWDKYLSSFVGWLFAGVDDVKRKNKVRAILNALYINSIATFLFVIYVKLEALDPNNHITILLFAFWVGLAGLMVFGFGDLRKPAYQRPLPKIFPDISISAYPKYGEYVYLIQDASASLYFKIGKTTNLHRRLKRFEVILPFKIHVVHIISCRNCSQTETRLHRKYAMNRVSGEWFQLTDADVLEIMSMKEDFS